MHLTNFIKSFFLLFLSSIKSAEAEGFSDLGGIYGCSISSSSEKISGFKGNAYYYPWLSYDTGSGVGVQNQQLYTTGDYLNGGYVGNGDIITQDHTTDFTVPNIIAENVTASIINFNNADVYGSSLLVPISNFAFHVTGYMIPETSGSYTISMGYIDDLGIINIGSGKFLSQNCCNNFVSSGDVGGNNTVESVWSYEGPTGVNVISADLVANVAYPISIFYVNRGNLGSMSLTYTDPSGEVHSDFSGFVYHFDE
ncbi:hypothetical protein HANVADRAFT_24164, partial [Hanseniaspora valbyensis NRRL Y-1626]